MYECNCIVCSHKWNLTDEEYYNLCKLEKSTLINCPECGAIAEVVYTPLKVVK